MSRDATIQSEPSSEQKEALIARGKKANADHRRRVQHFIDSNQKLLDSDTIYVGGGTVSLDVFVAYGILGFNIDFVGTPSGTLSFEGTDWTFGLGAWGAYGVATFNLPPDQLSGNGSVVVGAEGEGGAGVQLFVYDGNGVQYGSITCGGVGVGAAVGNISGSFTWDA